MVSPTNLRTNIVQNATGWFSDTNTVHAAINALTQQAYKQFNVREYGAVGDFNATNNTGTDDTAAFDAAVTAMKAQGVGTLAIPAGNYKVTHLPTLSPYVATGPLTYAIQGDGSGISNIYNFGTTQADSLTVTNVSFDPNNASSLAPAWQGFTIDGTYATGGCCGLVWGDVSYGSLFDIQVKNFGLADGFFFNNPYGWTEGMSMRSCRSEYNANLMHYDTGSGRVIGTVNATITSGTTFATITTTALTTSLYAGQQIVIAAATSAIGVTTQTLNVTNAVAAGATSFTVTGAGTTTASTTYTSGTAKLHWGGYGSFDYWTIDSLYLQANANQNGFVSEISRGIGQNMQRVGSDMRVTANFHTGATNTGSFFWIKGDDTWNDTFWKIGAEMDGTGTAHTSIKFTSGNGAITGFGRFVLAGFGATSFTGGGTYQFGPSGQIQVNGYSDSAGLVPRMVRRPGFIDVNSGVTPSGYTISTTTATAWQNSTGYGCEVDVTVTFTGTGTWTYNVDVWNGLPAGSTMFTGTTGQKVTYKIHHYNKMWARMDFTNCTVAMALVHYWE